MEFNQTIIEQLTMSVPISTDLSPAVGTILLHGARITKIVCSATAGGVTFIRVRDQRGYFAPVSGWLLPTVTAFFDIERILPSTDNNVIVESYNATAAITLYIAFTTTPQKESDLDLRTLQELEAIHAILEGKK